MTIVRSIKNLKRPAQVKLFYWGMVAVVFSLIGAMPSWSAVLTPAFIGSLVFTIMNMYTNFWMGRSDLAIPKKNGTIKGVEDVSSRKDCANPID